ncbi:MAG: HYExAFE family protein [Phycisphaerales bacterium]|nr:HYExAFE family protein [Phycisphaerales bacterium]
MPRRGRVCCPAMAQRRHHYERAFEAFLRSRRIPYVAVDEAKKALLPENAELVVEEAGAAGGRPVRSSLKSFDFVVYGEGSGAAASGGGLAGNLLIDIKGRRVGSERSGGTISQARLESWVTMEDIEDLDRWERLFGPGFAAAFVFIYQCHAQPPDALFQEIFEHHGVWYALRAVPLKAYREHMKVRSPRWGTVDLPRKAFEAISQPFVGAR